MTRRLVVLLGLSFALAACRAESHDPAEQVQIEAQRQSVSNVAPAAPAPAPAAAPAAPVDPALLADTPDERSPNEYRVVLDTTKGDITIAVHRAWSPKGADRFYTLVRRGYFTDVAFFRVIAGFMAQFGMHGNPAVNTVWTRRTIDDEPVVQSNLRGRITFAKTGAPNSRSNQFFINFGDNSNLDPMGFSPFGEVADMAVVDRIHSGYGEGAPRGQGPDQGELAARGNAYLRERFPNLDYIRAARIVEP